MIRGLAIIEAIWKGFFPTKRKRLELRLVTYDEAENLLEQDWQIAKEEDANRSLGFVYIERLEPEPTL